jgi:hypothetical protein
MQDSVLSFEKLKTLIRHLATNQLFMGFSDFLPEEFPGGFAKFPMDFFCVI